MKTPLICRNAIEKKQINLNCNYGANTPSVGAEFLVNVKHCCPFVILTPFTYFFRDLTVCCQMA